MPCRGNIAFSLLFVLLLSVSGLALLTHTDLHVKIIAARKEKWQAAAALEQALLLDLHRYRETLAAADMNAFAAPESEFFNAVVFPDRSDGCVLSQSRFNYYPLGSGEDFCVLRVLNRIEARKQGSRLLAASRAGVDLLTGNIPVGELGVAVDRQTLESPAAFLAGRGVEVAGSQLPLVADLPVASATGRLLAETLGLGEAPPGWRQIREKFNLEPSAAPVPPGVYLVRAPGTLAAVFIQGDLQKLEFDAGNGWQSIVFSRDGQRSELRYRPGLAAVTWSGSEDVSGLIFSEKIIVHGSVWGIEQAGSAAFLPASRIELLACGQIVVRSGLESENLALGKEKNPGLLLMTSDRDFFSDQELNADVVIDTAGEQTVQVQVVAAGALVNGSGRVEITGSLFAGDIRNAGHLQVDAIAGRFGFSSYRTLANFKFLKNFHVHFIQEGVNE